MVEFIPINRTLKNVVGFYFEYESVGYMWLHIPYFTQGRIQDFGHATFPPHFMKFGGPQKGKRGGGVFLTPKIPHPPTPTESTPLILSP